MPSRADMFLSPRNLVEKVCHFYSVCVFGAGDSYRRDFGQQHMVSYAKGGFVLAAESS